VRKLKSVVRAIKQIRKSAERHGVSTGRLLTRFVYLYRQRRFSPNEIFFNDLLNPRISDLALENYMSREEQITFDAKHVLDTYMCLTADKAVFYSLCGSAGVRVPKLFGVFDLPVGWTPDGQALSSSSEWITFAQSLPAEFVVKPALGLLGRGVTAFRREGTEFVDHDGHRRTGGEFYEFLCREKDQNLFSGAYSHHSLKLGRQGSHKAILQERLYAHPAIAELTGSRALCTCRVFTNSGGLDKTHVLASLFRAVSGGNIVDNFDRGATGNLWCTVDGDSGHVVEAFMLGKDGDRLELVKEHPITRRQVVGFCIPHWADVRALATHLAGIFRPQALIHWDIGITAEGPVVVEGNVGGTLLPTPLNRPVRTLLAEQ